MALILDGTNGVDKIAAGAIEYADLPSGSVLQVVSVNFTGQLNTTSLSYVTTGLTASITPKFASSKILAIASGNIYGNLFGTIYRNGSVDLAQNANGLIGSNVTNVSTATGVVLDSPSTTSSTSYAVYIKAPSGGSSPWWNINSATTNITLMEIAG